MAAPQGTDRLVKDVGFTSREHMQAAAAWLLVCHRHVFTVVPRGGQTEHLMKVSNAGHKCLEAAGFFSPPTGVV